MNKHISKIKKGREQDKIMLTHSIIIRIVIIGIDMITNLQ
jgi:hypothetical protein